ncbi:MAG: methylated-DNA--[protein]-cysteine S-methyltransferase [Archaeoglobaceae archaeon]
MDRMRKNNELKKKPGFSIQWNELYFNVEGEEIVKRAFFSKSPAFEFKDCELAKQIERYFKGEKVEFECEFELNLPAFTKKVLERVLKIPYGKTITYGELAKDLKSSPRAIGQALKRNTIAVLIPCHRVVAKNSIGGYSWGIEIKKALLRLEGLKIP